VSITQPAAEASTTAAPVAIQVRGLEKHFGSVRALDGVDLDVPAGSVLGLLGPNGAGKTTLVSILATLFPPSGGTATIFGIDVARDPAAVREVIGLAGQYAVVDEKLTGRENLRLIARLTHVPRNKVRARADELLEQFGLTDAADRQSGTYSGGMRRRLDLAAALVHSPPVLFLDEPTTGLDPQSRLDLWSVIRGLVADGTTLLLTTQYLEEADQLAEKIIVVNNGVVLVEGTAASLKARLGSVVVQVGLAAHQLEQARPMLSMYGTVEPLLQRSGFAIISDDDGAALKVMRALDRLGFAPESFVVREPTLDDIFLQLTRPEPERPRLFA
jgi:ABC-2 type transport system ATP-binding protein